jgi:hypothetical protein
MSSVFTVRSLVFSALARSIISAAAAARVSSAAAAAAAELCAPASSVLSSWCSAFSWAFSSCQTRWEVGGCEWR